MASPSLQTPSQVGTTVPDTTAAAAAAAAALSCTPRSRTKKSSCLSSHKAAAGSTGSRRWGGKPPPPRSLQCTHLRLGAVSPVALHAVVQSTSTPVHAAGATSPGSALRPTLLPPPPADPRPREGRCRAPGPPTSLQELRGALPPLSPVAWSPRPARALGRRRAGRCPSAAAGRRAGGHRVRARESGLEPAEERPSPPPPTPPTLACCGSAAAPTARAAGRQHRSEESRWRRREGGLEHGGTPPYRPAAASVTPGRRGPAVCSRAGRRGLPGSAPGGGAEASSPRRPPARVCPAPPPSGGRGSHRASSIGLPGGRLSKFADTPREVRGSDPGDPRLVQGLLWT